MLTSNWLSWLFYNFKSFVFNSITSPFGKTQSFFPLLCFKIFTYQRNFLYGFATLSEPNKLFVLGEVIGQDDKAPSGLGFAISSFLGPDLGSASAPTPALVLIPAPLPSIEKIFKQFMQMYMETV